MLDASMREPFVRIERQDKAKHVFENEHAGECLDGHFT